MLFSGLLPEYLAYTGVSGRHLTQKTAPETSRSLRPLQVPENPVFTGVSEYSTADLRKTAITFDPGVRFRRFWTLWKAYSEGYTSQLNSWPKTHRIKLGTLQNLFWTLPHFPLRTLNNKLSLWVWLGTLEHWNMTISSRCIPLNSAAYLDSISRIKHIWTYLCLLNTFKYRFFFFQTLRVDNFHILFTPSLLDPSYDWCESSIASHSLARSIGAKPSLALHHRLGPSAPSHLLALHHEWSIAAESCLPFTVLP